MDIGFLQKIKRFEGIQTINTNLIPAPNVKPWGKMLPHSNAWIFQHPIWDDVLLFLVSDKHYIYQYDLTTGVISKQFEIYHLESMFVSEFLSVNCEIAKNTKTHVCKIMKHRKTQKQQKNIKTCEFAQ